ncbi:putative LuxR family transcriptional regulator [Magnetofaba australis IT-1]|uniref:Putative LuxR family transcriptional regulator n=1 Tax=Magnetofaba australis IT-1 TaxID=1434232 RepID=A0A1Y2K785_9PROT|nr:putative LuxR family transcriptional regulator [Magnetofaba australis IT-1]
MLNSDPLSTTLYNRMLEPSGITPTPHSTIQTLFACEPTGSPAVILADMLFPDWAPLRLLSALRSREILHPVIFMSHRVETETLQEILEANAFAFIKKPINQVKLLELTSRALAWDEPRQAHLLRTQQTRRALRAMGAREREALQMSVGGLSARQIAERLGVSPRTVEKQKTAALRKLDVGSMAEAAALMAQREVSCALLGVPG